MDPEEKPKQIPIGRLAGVENALDHLGVGPALAMYCIRRGATGIAGSARYDVWTTSHQLPSQTVEFLASLGFLSEKPEVFAISKALKLITMNEAQRRGVYAVTQSSHIARSTRKQMT